MGLIADQHPAIHSVIAAAGDAHSAGMQSYLRMMAVRLLEMRRVLTPTGSIYLHCDPVAATTSSCSWTPFSVSAISATRLSGRTSGGPERPSISSGCTTFC